MVGQRHRDWNVDTDHADVDPVCEITCGVAIACIDRSTVAVFMVHRVGQSLIICFRTDCGQNWAKDFLLVDVHVCCDVVKQAWANKETIFVTL